MAEKLTRQQQQAVTNRGGKLLVSAAAGSGKTKVLVDRLLSYLLDETDPANLDDFLIITYTKAAAAELRGKIAAKLTEKMAEQPENRHLQRQMQRLYLAKISTVHSFCSDILREYAYRLELPADFRVADENECRELRETAMMQVLEEAYEGIADAPDFRAFLDTQGLGRDDRLVPDILMKVYDSARCHIDPEDWLRKCVANAAVENVEDAGETTWGKYLMQDLFRYLDLQIDALSRCGQLAAAADGMGKPAALLTDTVSQLERLRSAETWDQVYDRRKIDYGRLSFSKKCADASLVERIKAIRESCKKGLEKKLKSFSGDSAQVLEDMHSCSSSVRGMAELVHRFGETYDRLKKMRRVLDFGDLEQRMLDLLVGIRRDRITGAATEIGRRFREILVDEYQDSNGVQDAIFSALTQARQNCFMVGDVKQSIYQFRLADPGIFLEKYNEYQSVEDAEPGQGRKVLLSHNFRSSGGVLQGVNDIFSYCMSPDVGGLHYGEEEALREGIPHVPLEEPEVELLALDVQENTYAEEAELVAGRVAELLNGAHFVRQGETLRPIRPEDIAILLRSPGSVGSTYLRALEKRGIRCVSGGGEDLLQTEEISFLRCLLQVIGNPRQDIPLLAVLSSRVFCFTADDLAALRKDDHKSSIYQLLRKSNSPKAAEFLACLKKLRKAATTQTLTELLETVFSETKMDSLYGAMPGGAVRRENIQSFYALAADFEATKLRGLGEFLDFLDSMEAKGLMTAGEQSAVGAVTMMSIHKSKGLEFPVVLVCGLSREFNRESVRAQVLCDQELGLGLSAVDEENRVRYPTIAKRAIAVKTTMDSLSEEMRVLYVALTRARDRLIMTYAAGNLESELSSLTLRMDGSSPELLSRDVVCPGQWVLMAALRRTEAGELFAVGGKPEHTAPGSIPWKIRVVSAQEETAACSQPEQQENKPARILDWLTQGLSFRYPHAAATAAPSKQTATQRKGRDKDAEAAEHAPRAGNILWRRPSFVETAKDPTAYGNAVHACMQHIRFDLCKDANSVAEEIRRITQEGLLTQEQASWIPCEKIAAFFASELGQKFQSAPSVLREFKFSILDDGIHYDSHLEGEQILLQGVVDCALVEADGITIVDFKTDAVTEENVQLRAERYATQIRTYAAALARIYEKPVKEALLYFFQLQTFVKITI